MSSGIFKIQTHKVPCQYIREYPRAIVDQEGDLYLHVKQYTPQDDFHSRPNAITIIGAHANGFPKEVYEPLWQELCQRLETLGIAIRSIWMADQAHLGMSSVINQENLGNDPSWHDHPRDLLYMINHFHKEMPRPLIGIGHSMGGSQLVELAAIHPRLLTALILIDPVMQVDSGPLTSRHPSFLLGQITALRRDVWPSRTEAAESFRRSQYYQAWDPRVLDLFIEYGLHDLPMTLGSQHPAPKNPNAKPVTLTTSKHQELFTYARPHFSLSPSRLTHPDLPKDPTTPFYRPEPISTFLSLPSLRPSTLYIFGAQSPFAVPHLRTQKVTTTGTGPGGSGGVREGRVKEVVLDNVGHLVPMESVTATAAATANWLAGEIARWRKDEEEWRRGWEAKSRQEWMTISDEWKKHLGGDPRKVTSRASKRKEQKL